MSDASKKPEHLLEGLQELRDIYLEILQVEAKLVNMEQMHPAAARLREVITRALDELEEAYAEARADPAFEKELAYWLADYAGAAHADAGRHQGHQRPGRFATLRKLISLDRINPSG